MKRFIGCVLLALHALTAWASSHDMPLRLPGTITPTAYRLALQVDPNLPTHSGEVTISVDIKQPAQMIRLHAVDITVQSAVLKIGTQTLKANARQRSPDVLDLNFEKTFAKGQGELTISFAGKIEDKDS